MDNLLGENLRLIYIEWVDTIGDPDNGWKDEDDTEAFFERDDNIVRECGFLYNEDDEYIYFVGKYMPSIQSPVTTAHRTKIPKRWILTRQEFEYEPTKDYIKMLLEEYHEDIKDKAINLLKNQENDKA